MFGLFKKKTQIEKLQKTYESLMKDAYNLSRINRKESDQKYSEANAILKTIESLEKNKK
jgi:hypothetical protein